MIHHVRLLITTLILLLVSCCAVQAQQLRVTSVTPDPACASSSITVSFSYTAGDAGTLYLFLNGPATSDVLIAAASVNGGNGSIQGTIPVDRTTGTYTVRLLRASNTSGVIYSLNSSGFTINALPGAPGVSNVAYCLSATSIPPLTAMGQNLTWYPGASGGGGTTTAPTPPTSATGTTNYYVSQTVNGCEGPRATQQVTINPPPTKPTVVGSLSYCQGVTAPSLDGAVSSGNNLKWYTSAMGGTSSTIAPVPSTSDVGSITYYVSQTNFSNQTDGRGCESERAEITVTVKAAPAAPSVTTPATYCQDAVASPLSATAFGGGTLNWFGPSNNSLGSTPPTPPITATGIIYYSVSQTINGCEGPRATIMVTINPRPVAPTTTPVSVCQNTTPVSLATGITSGANLRWYTNPSGGGGATIAPVPPTSAVGQTTYYVSQVNNNGCESDRAVITFIVNGYPTAPSVSSVTYCQNATATSLTATAVTNATLNFYLTSSGGTRYASLIPSTTASYNYYVSQSLNGCEGARAMIAVNIRLSPPSPAVTLPAAYCQLAPATPLSATANTNFSLNWYSTNAMGGTASTVAPTPSTSNAGSFHYYVSQSDPFGCESVRADIPVTVNAIPTVSIMPNPSLTVSQGNSTMLTASGATSYSWSTGESTGAISVSVAGPYSVTGTTSGCSSVTSVDVTVTAATLTLSNFSASPDPLCVGKVVTFQATVGNVTGSYAYTLTNGSSTTTGTSSNTTFSQSLTTTVSGIQTFTLIVNNTGQSAMETYELTVNAPPIPTLTASNGNGVATTTLTCAQTTITLNADGGDDYLFSGPGILNQDPENGIAVVNAAGVYSVTVTTSETGCFSTTTTTVSSNTTAPSVSINPSSAMLTTASPSVSLTAIGTGTFRWSTGATTQVISATASGTYSVTLTSPGGCTASTSVSVSGADLTVTLDLPQANFAASGTASVGNFVVNVFEVGGLPTSSGNVTITVTAPIGYTLSFAGSLTGINVSGGEHNPVAVNNRQWTVSQSIGDRQLSLTMNSSVFISGGGESRLGFSLTRTSANSGSTANITVNVKDDQTMGYDSNLNNNVYARIISGL